MIAPVFSVCSASAEVIAILGSSPVRLYPFGEHYDNTVYPYAVWQNIGGSPENYLAQRPDADSYSVQIDVYANTSGEVIAAAKALRDAIEPHAYITRWGDQERDTQTRRYRYSFDVDWIVRR